MDISKNSKICITLGFALLVALSPTLGNYAAAIDDGLSLPTTLVTIEVNDGTESYFDTDLSGVPSGYDVTNRTYLGWCIDVRTEMARSPATHLVKLYSSNNLSGELADERWDMVNYILNHKQGNAQDIQQAIWYFISMDGNYTPTRSVAWVIVNDTLANGTGFTPGNGQTIAVICYPMIVFPNQPAVQISIIEVTNKVIPEFSSTLILPLFMLTMIVAAIIYSKAHTSRPSGK